jgi:hypothetical protein
MRIRQLRTVIELISGPALIAGGLAAFLLTSAGPAAAGQPVAQALTPSPPSFETCKRIGDGFICDGARTESYSPTDTGVACGSGVGAFDIFDQGSHNQHAIRFYNTAGDLTRRVIYDQYFSQFSNPLTGAAVPYTQHNTTTDILAVPGDLTSATETVTGEVNFTVPHIGAVFLNAGRTRDRRRRHAGIQRRASGVHRLLPQRQHRGSSRTLCRARGKLAGMSQTLS